MFYEVIEEGAGIVPMMLEETDDIGASGTGNVPIGTDFLLYRQNGELAVLHENIRVRVQVGFAFGTQDLFGFLHGIHLG